MANGVDFTYTVGLDAKTDQLTKKISSFQESLKKRPIDINIDFPGLKNQGAVKNALDSLGVSMDNIKKVTTQTITLTDKQGKSFDEAKKLTVQYRNEFGQLATAFVNVDNQTSATIKKQKEYDTILKSTERTLNSTQHVEEKQRQAIEKTADELNKSISEWKELASTHQANTPRAKELETKIKSLTDSLKQQEGATKTGAAGLQNFTTTMQRAIKQSFAYTLAMRAIRMAQQELNKAIKYTIDLNTEMTKIKILQVEGAKTNAEIDRLANSFNRLAQEMGATTLQVAEGSVEWLRQGKTIEETSKLLKSTLMLSKLGNMEAADATEKLTSTLNGYKMEASEVTSVVDKLVAVDNVAATSVKELTTALQYSAAVAKQTGVSFEQLVSYVGVVSETTRQNAESIGQGMKTMLTRMQDIKGGKLDEDSMGINNVEIALRKANIQLRDSKNSFRDFGTVLEELAGEWETLSETEQAFIAKSIAGIRQVNMFTVLMNNMSRALELQDVQFTSAGLATSRYQMYMESLEAKISVFKSTLEGLYQDAIESGFIGSIIDAGTKILKMIKDMGGLEVAVKRLTVAYIALKVAMFALNNLTTLDNINQGIKFFIGSAPAFQGAIQGVLKGLVDSGKGASGLATILKKLIPSSVGVTSSLAGTGTAATGAATGFGALASAALPWIAVGAVVIGTAIAIEKAVVTQKEAYEGLIDAQEEAAKLGEQISNVEELKKKYDELKIASEDNTKSEEEQVRVREELDNVIDELAKKLPGLTILYDDEGKSVAIVAANYEELARNLKSAREEQEKFAKENAEQFLFNQTGGGMGAQSFQYSDTGKLEQLYGKATRTNDADDWNEYYKKLGEYGEAFSKVGVEGAETFIATLNEGINNDVRNNLIEIANEVAKFEAKQIKINREKAISDYYKGLTEKAYREQGKNETQIESRMKFGSEQDYIDYLISDKIPSLNKGIEQLKESFETLSNGKIIGVEQIDSLRNLGIIVKTGKDNVQELFYEIADANGNVVPIAIKSSDDFANVLLDVFKNTEITTEEILAFAESYFSLTAAEQDAAINATKLEAAHKELMSQTSELVSAMKEQGKQGYISAETALEIAQSNGELFRSLKEVEGGYTLTQEAVDKQIIALQNSMNSIFDEVAAGEYDAQVKEAMSEASEAAALGNYALALSAIDSTDAAFKESIVFSTLADILERLANISLTMPVFQGFGGSGGSGSRGEDPRIKENEELIEQLEDQIELEEDKIDLIKDEIDLEKEKIDALKKVQDEYEDWIDQKKESLKLAKEESDYYKEQQKDLKSLADIRKQISLLEFDTSEEATAKRQELEAKAFEMEEDIAEKAEDYRHEQQMQALDNLQKSFETMIEKQIEGIQAIIDAKEDQIKVIKDGIGIFKDQISDIRDIIADIRDEGRSGGSGTGYTKPGALGVSMQTWLEGSQTPVTNTIVTDQLVFPVSASPLITGTHEEGPIDVRSAYDEDKNVYAMQSGTIVSMGENGGYGKTIAIEDANGRILTTSHFSELGDLQVGQNVNAGDIIGQVDEKWTGQGTGEHLHLEMWQKTEEGLKRVALGLNDFGDGFDYANANIPEAMENIESIPESVETTLFNFGVKLNEETSNAITGLLNSGKISAEDLNDAIELINDGTITLDGSTADLVEQFKLFGIDINATGTDLRDTIKNILDISEEVKQQTKKYPKLTWSGQTYGGRGGGVRDVNRLMMMHSGGLVESHHDGDFAGNLRSNEVFSKLLKGEYVATEGQMDNFLKNILPTIATNIPTGRYNQSSNINVSMPINVEGNLDKSVIPDIKKIANQVIEEINRSLISRGYVRPANNTLS